MNNLDKYYKRKFDGAHFIEYEVETKRGTIQLLYHSPFDFLTNQNRHNVGMNRLTTGFFRVGIL